MQLLLWLKLSFEMHKQMSSVSLTYAAIPRTLIGKMLVMAIEMPAETNSHVSIQYASTVELECKNNYVHR